MTRTKRSYFPFTAAFLLNRVLYTRRVTESIKQVCFQTQIYKSFPRIGFIIKRIINVIYYVLSGSVDDADGIMFINGAENGVLGGVKKVERIGGNYYRYSTYD